MTSKLTIALQDNLLELVQALGGPDGMDYDTFNRRVTLDEAYLDQLNQEQPLWEVDAIEWALWAETGTVA